MSLATPPSHAIAPYQRSRPVIVVTGASSGIGRATARALAEKGARLVLVARRDRVLAEVVEECRQRGGLAIACPADVGDSAAVSAVMAETLACFGRCDVWINAAGVIAFGRVEEISSTVTEKLLRTNLLGVFNGSQAAIGQFRRQERGTLINVSSVLAITGQPYAAAYVASKAAIRGMDEAVRQENADMKDIHVATVLPYAIDTPVYQRGANVSGRAARPVFPRYAPETVAAEIVGLVMHPRREVFAGKVGAFAALGKMLFPRLSDGVLNTAVNLVELSGPAQQPTDGNVHVPIEDQWQVDGGWRSRGPSRGGTKPAVALAVAGLASIALLSVWHGRRSPR